MRVSSLPIWFLRAGDTERSCLSPNADPARDIFFQVKRLLGDSTGDWVGFVATTLGVAARWVAEDAGRTGIELGEHKVLGDLKIEGTFQGG